MFLISDGLQAVTDLLFPVHRSDVKIPSVNEWVTGGGRIGSYREVAIGFRNSRRPDDRMIGGFNVSARPQIPEERLRPSVSISDLNGEQRLIGTGVNDSNSQFSHTSPTNAPPDNYACRIRIVLRLLRRNFSRVFFYIKHPIYYTSPCRANRTIAEDCRT